MSEQKPKDVVYIVISVIAQIITSITFIIWCVSQTDKDFKWFVAFALLAILWEAQHRAKRGDSGG